MSPWVLIPGAWLGLNLIGAAIWVLLVERAQR